MSTWSLETIKADQIFKPHLGTKAATIFCLLAALLNKSLIAWIYTDLSGDKSLYLLFAQQLLSGEHPLEPLGLINGQQNYFFNGAITSPLYSFLAAPLLGLTGSAYATSVIIDVLAWLVFFTGLFRLARLALGEVWAANLLVLCAGFFLYPHELQSPPKDVLAVGLILWAVVVLANSVKAPSRSRALLLACLLIAVGLTKFLYVPLVLLMVLLLWYFAFNTQANLKATAVVVTLVCVGAFVAFFLYLRYLKGLHQQTNIEMPPPMDDFQEGFFPQNLTATFPFISSALLNVNFWCTQLADILKVPFKTVYRFFQGLDLLLVLPLMFFLKRFVSRSKPAWLIGTLAAAALVCLLMVMSLRYKAVEYHAGASWTHVKESRSFLFVMIVLQVGLFYLVFYSALLPALKNFLLLLFLIECLHGAYFTTKQVINRQAVAENLHRGGLHQTVRRLKALHANTAVFLSTPNAQLRQLAQVHGIPVAYYAKDRCAIFQTAADRSLLVALHQDELFFTGACVAEKEPDATEPVAPFMLRYYFNSK